MIKNILFFIFHIIVFTQFLHASKDNRHGAQQARQNIAAFQLQKSQYKTQIKNRQSLATVAIAGSFIACFIPQHDVSENIIIASLTLSAGALISRSLVNRRYKQYLQDVLPIVHQAQHLIDHERYYVDSIQKS